MEGIKGDVICSVRVLQSRLISQGEVYEKIVDDFVSCGFIFGAIPACRSGIGRYRGQKIY
jgi:hypothetical protein